MKSPVDLKSLDDAMWGDGEPDPALLARASLLAAKEAMAVGAGAAATRLLARAVELTARRDTDSPRTPFDVELSLTVAEQAFIEGRLDDVNASAGQALDVAQHELADATLTARAHLLLARGLATGTDLDRATPHFEQAASLFHGANATAGDIQVGLSYGFALLDAERSEDAEEVFEQARVTAAAANDPALLGRALGYLGNTARYRGRYARAQAYYLQAIETLAPLSNPTWKSVFAMDAGMCALCCGDVDTARPQLEGAQIGFAQLGHRKLFRLTTSALRLARLWADPTENIDDTDADIGDAATDAGADQDPTLERNCALYALAAAAVQHGGQSDGLGCGAALHALPPTPARSDQHNIIARRIVDVIVAEQTAERAVWTLSHDATTVVTPQGETIALSRYPLLSRLVLALAAAHRLTPGTVLPPDRLFASGWPDEKAITSAVKNRVRVAISTLRRKGMRELIVSQDGGYLLAQDVTVRFDAK